jgi:DNA-directed RNA polymerase subunit RPC12/RpoP
MDYVECSFCGQDIETDAYTGDTVTCDSCGSTMEIDNG